MRFITQYKSSWILAPTQIKAIINWCDYRRSTLLIGFASLQLNTCLRDRSAARTTRMGALDLWAHKVMRISPAAAINESVHAVSGGKRNRANQKGQLLICHLEDGSLSLGANSTIQVDSWSGWYNSGNAKKMPRLPTNLTGIPEEPIQDFTKPPVIEGVARKPSNEIVIPLEELEKKTQSGFEVPNKGRSPSFWKQVGVLLSVSSSQLSDGESIVSMETRSPRRWVQVAVDPFYLLGRG